MLNIEMYDEWRSEERVPVSLAVTLFNTHCMTRDVSASGVFLEANANFFTGERIDFAIEFDNPGGKLLLNCMGKIIRAEKRNGKTGVAVKIIQSVMKSVEGSPFRASNNGVCLSLV